MPCSSERRILYHISLCLVNRDCKDFSSMSFAVSASRLATALARHLKFADANLAPQCSPSALARSCSSCSQTTPPTPSCSLMLASVRSLVRAASRVPTPLLAAICALCKKERPAASRKAFPSCPLVRDYAAFVSDFSPLSVSPLTDASVSPRIRRVAFCA
jgi:hypothetical protein